MGYRPQPNVEETLISFEQGTQEKFAKTYEDYVKNLDKFLESKILMKIYDWDGGIDLGG